MVGYTQEAVNFNPLLYVNTGVETSVEFAVFDFAVEDRRDRQVHPEPRDRDPVQGERRHLGRRADLDDQAPARREMARRHSPSRAKDVVFTYQTMINPKNAVRGRTGHDRVKDFVALDDHTIKATLAEPFAPYLVVWQKTSIVPQHLLADVPDMNTAAFNTQPVGTGPFKFKTRVGGRPHRVRGLSGLPRRRAAPQHADPEICARPAGALRPVPDRAGADPRPAGPAARTAAARAATAEQDHAAMSTSFVEFIYFNCGKPQFSDKRVRKALYMAMDRKTLIDKLYYGVPKRTLSYLPPDHWAYNSALKDPGYDPAKAAAMLDEAGWKVGSDGVREKDGVKLSFTISTTAGNKSRERSQQFLQQNLKAVNVDMQINNMPASVVWGEYTVQVASSTRCRSPGIRCSTPTPTTAPAS